MFDLDGRAKLYDNFGAKQRLHGRNLSGFPTLDALLPYYEYTVGQLERSPLFDQWLSAAVCAASYVTRAAEILAPLGIQREDLLLLLQKHMKNRLREQKINVRKKQP